MPIPAKLHPDDPDVPPVPPDPRPDPDVPGDWTRTQVSIIGHNGEGDEICLTCFSGDSGIFIQEGATGLDLPPMDVKADASPNFDGGWFRSVRAIERQIMLPLFLQGSDRRSIRRLKRSLADSLNPKNGSCILRVTEGDGVVKHLTCWYVGGMEGDEGHDSAGFTWCRYVLHLTAFDPWWYGQDMVSASWDTGSTPSGKRVWGEIEVLNNGDVESWPQWEFYGPFKSFAIEFPDGRGFAMSRREGFPDLVGSGQVLRVDTRPGFKTVSRSDGLNMWPFIDPKPEMFPFPAGRSRFAIALMPGAFTASMQMFLTPRFESF